MLGKSLTRPLQGTPARPEARGRRGRRRRSTGTRWLDEWWSGPRLRQGFGGGLARARGERAAEMERGVGGGRWGKAGQVGGEGAEASGRGGLTHPRRCRRGGRAASRPCSGAHQGNRKGGRASGSWAGQASEVGRPAGMGRSPRGGQGLSHPSSFSVPFFSYQRRKMIYLGTLMI